MAVIDGNVMAINPSEETKMQMFIWNNIFFSLGLLFFHAKQLSPDSVRPSTPRWPWYSSLGMHGPVPDPPPPHERKSVS